MTHTSRSFPFFIPVEPRQPSLDERAVIDRLLFTAAPEYQQQARGLVVVGRCGCMTCPTIFFLPHEDGDVDQDLTSMIGADAMGTVGAILMHKAGVLSQLEFYSADGHNPWTIPLASSLNPTG
jgi:hypothetical protein